MSPTSFWMRSPMTSCAASQKGSASMSMGLCAVSPMTITSNDLRKGGASPAALSRPDDRPCTHKFHCRDFFIASGKRACPLAHDGDPTEPRNGKAILEDRPSHSQIPQPDLDY